MNGMIETADFAGAATSTTNEGTLPTRISDGYIWFGVPVAAGYPAELAYQQRTASINSPCSCSRRERWMMQAVILTSLACHSTYRERRCLGRKRSNWGTHGRPTETAEFATSKYHRRGA